MPISRSVVADAPESPILFDSLFFSYNQQHSIDWLLQGSGLGSVIDLREGRDFSFFGLLGSPSLTIVNRDGSTQD